MTTVAFDRLHDSDGVPSLGRFMAYKVGKHLDRKEGKQAKTRIQSIVRLLLHIAGFACLTIAGFTCHPVAGFVVAGLSCFTFSLLTVGESNSTTADSSSTRR